MDIAEYADYFHDGNVINIKHHDENNTLLKQTLKRSFEKLPSQHSYKLYPFRNEHNAPILEIVCASYIINLCT